MQLIAVLCTVALGAAWLWVLPRVVGRLLTVMGLARPNFKGAQVPVGYGLLVVFWSVPALAALGVLVRGRRAEMAAWILAVGAFGLLGFVDDRWGDRRTTGFSGHLRVLVAERQLTTGAVKALGGAAVAVLSGFILAAGGGWQEWLPVAVVVALTANAVNLLDVRPGRACAAFLVVAAALLSVQFTAGPLPALLLVVLPAAVCYPPDARARVMLGDTGSNALGAALGLATCETVSSLSGRLVLIGLLIGLHIVAERWSLSHLIDRVPALRRLDSYTGRR